MLRPADDSEPCGDLRRLVLQKPNLLLPSSPVRVPRKTGDPVDPLVQPCPGSPCSLTSASPLSSPRLLPASSPPPPPLPAANSGPAKTIRRVRSHGKLSVNRPLSKSDYSNPQKCINGRFGRMRRSWTFLDLETCSASVRRRGEDAADCGVLSSTGSPAKTMAKSLSLCTLDSLLADRENKVEMPATRRDFIHPVYMDQS